MGIGRALGTVLAIVGVSIAVGACGGAGTDFAVGDCIKIPMTSFDAEKIDCNPEEAPSPETWKVAATADSTGHCPSGVTQFVPGSSLSPSADGPVSDETTYCLNPLYTE